MPLSSNSTVKVAKRRAKDRSMIHFSKQKSTSSSSSSSRYLALVVACRKITSKKREARENFLHQPAQSKIIFTSIIKIACKISTSLIQILLLETNSSHNIRVFRQQYAPSLKKHCRHRVLAMTTSKMAEAFLS
jgi:hypothetical protein